jgi:predicted RNA-binding protein with PUA-like domain
MAYWLFKSEPNTWGWDDQIAKGDAGEEWDGVRNYQARNFMREMKLGDRGFFYHSMKEKCVDIKAVRPFINPVTLDQIKADPHLSDMVLVKNSRLSVQPVTETEWRIICDLGQTKP